MTSLAYTRTRRSVGEQAVRYGLFAAAAVSIVTTTLIILSLLRETIAFFGDVPIGDFLFGTKWSPLFNPPSFGVLPLVAGTLFTTLIGIAVAIPLGLGGAIYLSEYARPRVRKTIKPLLELLAGVPTIVGGPYFTDLKVREAWRRIPGLTALSVGENEFAAADLVECLASGAAADSLPAIATPTMVPWAARAWSTSAPGSVRWTVSTNHASSGPESRAR